MTSPVVSHRKERLAEKFFHLIDGELVSSDVEFEVINPATAEPFARCPSASPAQLDTAVAAARRAGLRWRETGLSERRDLIGELANRLREHGDELSELLVLEQGKPLAAARSEIERAAASMVEICSAKILPEVLRDDEFSRVELHYKPLGVIGAITPWNVPIALAAPKMASALYSGNGFVLKPSPYTPLTTLRMGAILRDILPKGLVNILAGADSIGRSMTEHPGIDKISFTGSVKTGKQVMESGSATLKRLTLELGGNDAAIVLDDADFDEIAPKLFRAAFGLSGQVCMAIKRLFVPANRYEEMVAHMTRLARSAKVGDGFEDDVDCGPVQNKAQFDRVMELIAETKGRPEARITAGGYALDRPGYFIAPTIVAGLREGAPLVDEEPFGPILPILSYATIEEAISRANATIYGLGGSVWTRDAERGGQIAARLDAGFTWVNHHVGTTRDLPFGGMKHSGIGRQGHTIGVTSDMEAQVVVIPKV